MDPRSHADGEVAGLNIYLAGSFDPRVFLEGFALRASKYEQARDNSITVLPKDRQAIRTVPVRKIERDAVAFVVPGDRSVPALFEALFSAIAGMSPEARSAWDTLAERTVDLGVNWMNDSNLGTEYAVPARIIKALGAEGLSLRISVYATPAAIEKACREARENPV